MKLGLVEGERVEFKQSVNDGAVKAAMAFANCDGGKIYIGVSDDGEIVGVDEVDNELLRFTDKMRTNIRPDILMMVGIDVESFGDKNIIVATVGKGPKRPYYLASKGLRPEGVYVRAGASSVPSSETAILQMVRESSEDSFERRLCLRQDLSFEFATSYFAQSDLGLADAEMRTLGMLAGKKFTNLALLLSDQCPTFVKAASFDDDSRDVFLEREEFCGSILKQLEDAYGFLVAHDKFKTGYEGLRRVDYDDYPRQALREAIVNAVVHREYALSGPTLVNVMPSSVEIASLGGLVVGITQEDLGANISMPRNKLLAALMYRLGIIEAWGTGIGRMRSSYAGSAVVPQIAVTPNTFTVKLPNRNVPVAALGDVSGNTLGNVSGAMRGSASGNMVEDASENALGDASGNALGHAPGNASGGVRPSSAGQDAVMKAVEEGCSTRAEIQQRTGFSQSKAIGLLRDLVDGGMLKREGESRSTRYALPER